MGIEYSLAVDMFLDEATFPFPNGLSSATAANDLSIVIHGTGTSNGIPTAAQLAQSLTTQAGHPSYHFIVDQNGVVGQLIHLADGAGGNCCLEAGYDTYWTPRLTRYSNLNFCTISIGHSSNSNNSSYTAIQLNASFALVRWLANKFSIPAAAIKTHASLDPLSRSECPGTYPMSSLISFITNGGSMLPGGWSNSMTNGDPRITAPNGRWVRGGFMQYILSHDWDADDQPLEQETQVTSLELSNPSLGPGTRQQFTFTALEMQKGHGNVIKAYTGQERLYLTTLVTQLQASLAAILIPPTLANDLTAAAITIAKLQQDIATAHLCLKP